MVTLNISASTTVQMVSKRVLGDLDDTSRGLVISDGLLARLEGDIKPLADQYSRPKDRSPELLDQLVDKMKGFSPEEFKTIGDYTGIRNLVTEALTCFEEAITSEPLVQRYKRFLKDTVNETTAKLMSQGLEAVEARKKAIDLIRESKDEMLIKFTTTVHPTNPWTREAIIFKRDLTRYLEDLANYAKGGAIIHDDSYRNIKSMIQGFAEKVKAGLPIVHIKQVDVAQERKVGREDFAIIGEYQKDTVGTHNIAIFELQDEKFFSKEETDGLYFEKDKTPFAKYTWIDADADGRPATCAEDLARVIPDCLKDNTKLDLRQNAEIHENLVSALIQVLFKNKESDFSRFCGEFVSHLNTLDVDGRNFRSPEKSIYQQLGTHRAEFLKLVLKSNYNLVPRSIVAHAVPYTEMYWKKFDEFVARERQQNPAIPEGISYAGLEDFKDPLSTTFANLQRKFREEIGATPVEFELDGKKIKWNFKPGKDGYHYEQTTEQGDPDFFVGTKKTYEATEEIADPATKEVTKKKVTKWKDMEGEELHVLMDTLRRLEIMRDAIEKYGPGAVAERYEIANFSDEANFYELLLLFKETGLVEIKDGLVIKADLDIMPLLETLEDLEKADEIFDRILNDPLALSYFNARGNKAQIMLGFSDGAKSGGNFASETAILEKKEKLARKFAAKGIIVEYKDGRGNTVERGGMPELGLSQTGSPDIVNARSKHSQTIQSDHHVQLANSPVRGRNQMLSTIMGTIAAKISAVTRSDKETELMNLCNEAADFIKRISNSHYAAIIRHNPNSISFQKAMPFNAEASSRKSTRAVSEKPPFDLIRAVPWTQKFGTAGAPANYVGLKEALEIFMSGEEVEITELDGTTSKISSKDLLERMNKLAYPEATPSSVREFPSQYGPRVESNSAEVRYVADTKQMTPGQKALEVLRTHPTYGNFLRRAETELDKNFDPHMAAAWGKKTNHQGFVGRIVESLTGLPETIKFTLRRFVFPSMANFTESLPRREIQAQQIIARAALLSAPKNPRMDNPSERPTAVGMKNFLMVSAGNDHTPNPTARMQDIHHRYSADGNAYAGAGRS